MSLLFFCLNCLETAGFTWSMVRDCDYGIITDTNNNNCTVPGFIFVYFSQ